MRASRQRGRARGGRVSSDDRLVLAVERPVPGVVVLRVAGMLGAGSRLPRLLETLTSGPSRPRHIVVDLGDVCGYGAGGLDVLVHAEPVFRRLGIGVHVCGVAARAELLPLAVVGQLAAFSGFPTVERAVAALASGPVEAGRSAAPAAIARLAHPRRPSTRS